MRWQEHYLKWKGCENCGLCNYRQLVILGKGVIPCDVCFIGEAPGISEDSVGLPFVGPAGLLLDKIIAKSKKMSGINYRSALTNLIACIPRSEDGSKNEAPLPEEIDACSSRLREFVSMAQPKLIICVGTLSRKYLDRKMKRSVKLDTIIPMVSIDHPAYILRMNIAQQSLAIQRAVVILKSAVEDYLDDTRGIPGKPPEDSYSPKENDIPF